MYIIGDYDSSRCPFVEQGERCEIYALLLRRRPPTKRTHEGEDGPQIYRLFPSLSLFSLVLTSRRVVVVSVFNQSQCLRARIRSRRRGGGGCHCHGQCQWWSKLYRGAHHYEREARYNSHFRSLPYLSIFIIDDFRDVMYLLPLLMHRPSISFKTAIFSTEEL